MTPLTHTFLCSIHGNYSQRALFETLVENACCIASVVCGGCIGYRRCPYFNIRPSFLHCFFSRSSRMLGKEGGGVHRLVAGTPRGYVLRKMYILGVAGNSLPPPPPSSLRSVLDQVEELLISGTTLSSAVTTGMIRAKRSFHHRIRIMRSWAFSDRLICLE